MVPFKILGIGTLIAWGALGLVVLKFDPLRSGFAVVLLFYLAFSLAISGTVMFGGLRLQQWRKRTSVSRHHVGIAGRQAALFTLFLVLLLILAARRMLLWWNVVPLGLLIIMIELFMLSLTRRERSRRPPPLKITQ